MVADKRFIISMTAQVVVFAVNILINIFLTPYIVENVGKEAYGFLGLALNFVNYAQLITIALNSMASRYISISVHQNDLHNANKYFTSVFYANICFSIILSIIFCFIIINLEVIVNIPSKIIFDVKLLFLFISLNFIISIITSVYGVAVFAKNRLDLSSIRIIISNVIKIAIIILCFSFLSPNIWYIGLASFLTTIYLYFANYKLTKNLLPEFNLSYKYIDIQKIKELIKAGIWNTLNKLSGILNVGLDLLIANLFIGSAAMGTLSLAKAIPAIILSIFATIAGVYSPNLTASFALNKYDDMKHQLFSSIKFMGYLSSIPIAILFAYGDVFFSLWVPNEDSSLIHILSILTCLELCFALPQEGLWNIFTVMNKVKTTSLNLFFMGALTFASSFVAMHIVDIDDRIYYLGGIMSFWGTMRLIIFLPIYGAKCLDLKWSTFYPVLIKNSLSILILSLISLILKKFLTPESWILLIFVSLLTTCFGLVLNFYLILEKKERSYLFGLVTTKIRSR